MELTKMYSKNLLRLFNIFKELIKFQAYKINKHTLKYAIFCKFLFSFLLIELFSHKKRLQI